MYNCCCSVLEVLIHIIAKMDGADTHGVKHEPWDDDLFPWQQLWDTDRFY